MSERFDRYALPVSMHVVKIAGYQVEVTRQHAGLTTSCSRVQSPQGRGAGWSLEGPLTGEQPSLPSVAAACACF